jgi:hypothetical protein
VDSGGKLLDRMRRTPFGWSQDDLRRLYEAYGFEVRQGARHLVVRHHEQRDLVTTVARHDERPPAYARTAVRPIEEVMRRRRMMSEGGGTG